MADRSKYFKKIAIFFVVCFLLMVGSYIKVLISIPREVTLVQGEEYKLEFNNPFLVSLKIENNGVLEVKKDQRVEANNSIEVFENTLLKTNKHGHSKLNLVLFGFIPFRDMDVDVVPDKKLIACGTTIGVKLKTKGILVIGVSFVEDSEGEKHFPAKDAGIKPGDLIVQIDQYKLDSVDDMIKAIDASGGKTLKIKYLRKDSYKNTEMIPIKGRADNKLHVGMWVRDSMAGIGTMTFYSPDNHKFAALGHGITDVESDTVMPVLNGEIFESNIVAVKKGANGNPGELKGIFLEDDKPMGNINRNCDYGIYGTINNEAIKKVSGKLYSIGVRSQVKEGPATILANVNGRSVEEFGIEIQRVIKQAFSGSKGMVIKVTDKRLLEATGGIVQGMSGSPIIQDNKIVGAVTHVLVNDPTRGYGIFVEWMLKNITDENEKSYKKPA